MKKILSSILALAMILSLSTFTVNAAMEDEVGYYHVSFEQAKAGSIASGDINKLAVGDLIYAVVTVKDANTFFAGQIRLTWDPDVLQISEATGVPATTFVRATNSRMDNTAKETVQYYVYNEETGEDELTTSTQLAIEYAESDAVYTESSIEYKCSVKDRKIDDNPSNTYDYKLNGDTTFIKVRFKILKTEDPKLTFEKCGLLESKANGDATTERAKSGVDTLNFDSVTPDPEPTTTTSYFGANVNTAEKPSLAQILVYTFTTNDEGAKKNTATKEINLGKTTFDSPTTIKTAAKVSGIPDGVTVGCSVAWK